MKKLGLWLAALGLVVCASAATVACTPSDNGNDTSSSATIQQYLEFNENAMTLEKYGQRKLVVTTNVSDNIVWTTSDASVATVENGVVSAVSVGTATITATAGSVSATCVVTVTHLSNFPELTVSETVVELLEGGEGIVVEAVASYMGEVKDCEFTWTTANPSIATVENGKITPVAVGETTVTVTTVCMGEILVKEIPVLVKFDEQIQVSKGAMSLALTCLNPEDILSDTFFATAYVKGVVNSNAVFTYESSDEDVAVATVTGDVVTVTAVGAGVCSIDVYYTSAENGIIHSAVSVTVSRAKGTIDGLIEITYDGKTPTAVNVASLDLVGEFEGIYCNGELISETDGTILTSFAQNNKGQGAMNIELRTDVASYAAQLSILAPHVPTIAQGENRSPMATYDGDVTEIGFEEGTTVYTFENASPDYAYTDGWYKRSIISAPGTQDYITIEFTVKVDIIGNQGVFHVWGEDGVPDMGAIWTTTAGKNAITDMEGNAVSDILAGTHYLVRIACEGLKEVQVGFISVNNTVYFGDISYEEEGEFVMVVTQGDDRRVMPTYVGAATEVGFDASTGTVYMLETSGALGWDNRMIIPVEKGKQYVKFDFVLAKAISNFTMWPENSAGTQGSYSLYADRATTSDADASRTIFVVDASGKKVTSFEAGKVYTVYFYLTDEISVHFSSFHEVTTYVANIECGEGLVTPEEPTISQGEARGPMPIYEGDVTAFGFEEGTVVYEVVGAQSNSNDVKLVAKIDSTGDVAYAKADVVFSSKTSSFGLWITAKSSHLGYYTITPTGFTTDGNGDPSRDIFVTDKDGERVTSFEANTVYTLYVGLEGREVTIQLTTWAALTMYIANIGCVTEAQAPVEPVPPVQGKELSILFIGNSFSDDTETYVVDILLGLGYTNINVGNLYIGGCSIDTHYDNITKNASAYDFRMRSHNGKKYTEYETGTVGGEQRSIAYAIAYKDWDIISVQQASGESGIAGSYKNLDALVSEVKKQATNSDVEIVFNMTWAYQGDSTHPQFPDYDNNQITMYNAIVSAVQAKVGYTVVPNGTAIQNARTSLLGDTLTRDGYHLDLKIGRFIAGLTFVAKVTGEDITDLEYRPGGINDLQFEIALESVLNALENPFEVTESEVTEEMFADPDVTAGGSNATAVTTYKGDVTALGFAEGTRVYEYVGVNSSSDKASIKVDSSQYDYVEVDLVITKGSGYFFMHGLSKGNWHNSGTSYVVDPGWIRLGDGNNTASDRVIEVYDANGNKVTSLMKNNVVYTLRVYIKVGNLDEIRISMNGSTIYFANVKQGNDNGSEPSDKPTTNPVVDSNGNALPLYKGDVTALGFTAGATVYESVQDNRTDNWSAGTQLGLTMEQQAIKIQKSLDEDYVSVYFSLSRDLTNPNYAFFAWWYDANGTNKGSAGFLKANGGFETRSESPADFKVVAYDMDGNVATSFVANTVYEMRWYSKSATAFKIGCCEKNGQSITVYYADPSSGNDEVVEPDGPVNPDAPYLEQGDDRTKLYAYGGDVTALGFAAGTTVYKMEHDTPNDSYGYGWDKRVAIPAPATQDYITIEFVLANTITGDSPVFHAWGPKGAPSITHIWTNTIEVGIITQMDGSMITELLAGTHYLLHVACKGMDEVQIGLISGGNTAYIANVSYNNGKLGAVKVSTTPTYSADGDHTGEAAAIYAGDVTALGFAEGAIVYEQVIADGWNDRVAIAVDNSYDYVDIQFSLTEETTFCVWFNDGPLSMLQGNYTVSMQGEAVACNGAAARKIQILDENGNVVTAMETNKVYTLRVYIEGLIRVQLSTYSGARTIYYGEVSFGNEVVSDER